MSGAYPGALQIESVSLPSEVESGEEFVASMTTVCEAGAGCAETVTISHDGIEHLNQYATPNEGEEYVAAANVSIDTPGDYTFQFNVVGGDTDFATVTVVDPDTGDDNGDTGNGDDPGDGLTGSLNISIETIPSVGDLPTVGETATIEVTVQNDTNQVQNPRLDVTVDGRNVGTLDYGLGSGSSQTRSTSWTPSSSGSATIRAANRYTDAETEHLTFVEEAPPDDGQNGGNGDGDPDDGEDEDDDIDGLLPDLSRDQMLVLGGVGAVVIAGFAVVRD